MHVTTNVRISKIFIKLRAVELPVKGCVLKSVAKYQITNEISNELTK